ncbi:chlorophyllase-1-like [Haliotis rufescens]|uniref:chlorophyllase-1-like n=1 Tax=Haliotis rufescens TaxID=6454 RepID=UPI00201F7BD1|nr:chlorophyllase-1-like [Haliotis rufescens]
MKSIALLFIYVTIAKGMYVDHGDPYKPGTLATGKLVITSLENHSPLHAVVYYPSVPGDYGVVFFIPGFDGVILSEYYSDYLSSVAQHGFIVVGSDYIWPASDHPGYDKINEKLGFITDKYVEQFNWMKSNLQGLIQGVAPGVASGWEHIALLSHSAGADALFKMAERNHTLFQSVVLWEPFSFQFNTPTNFSLPALIVGTQLSTRSASVIPCIIPGFGFDHFYSMWGEPPKVLMNVENFGHCDIMDNSFRLLCIDTKMCVGGNASAIPSYQQFAQGVTSAFLISTLQGYTQDITYVIDQNKIPLPLVEFKYNMSAPSSKHWHLSLN